MTTEFSGSGTSLNSVCSLARSSPRPRTPATASFPSRRTGYARIIVGLPVTTPCVSSVTIGLPEAITASRTLGSAAAGAAPGRSGSAVPLIVPVESLSTMLSTSG